MSDQMISTKKAAELLGVSQRTIQNWVDNGKLKSLKTAGGHRRLNPDDVRDFLKQNHFHQEKTFHAASTETLPPGNDLLRVLIVEDDANILRLCELRFSKFSIPHNLYMASNVFQALLMAGKYQPHIIFTDLRLPHIDGLQMINALLKYPETENTHIVVVTGLETKEVMRMGKIPQGITVLPKPIPFNTVETILYQQALAQNLQTTIASES